MKSQCLITGEPDSVQLDDVASIIGKGGVALLPTDTIYGLHTLAHVEIAIQRLSLIKGRDDRKPFVVLGASMEQLENAGVIFTPRSRSVLNDLWPGPLSAIVPLKHYVAASRGAGSLAVRVPASEWLLQLIERTGPLASTSANRSGETPIITLHDLPEDIRIAVDAIVDCGRQVNEPSAIVDFTGDEPRFIRQGEKFFTQKVWKTLRKSL